MHTCSLTSESHSPLTKMTRALAQLFYWPGQKLLPTCNPVPPNTNITPAFELRHLGIEAWVQKRHWTQPSFARLACTACWLLKFGGLTLEDTPMFSLRSSYLSNAQATRKNQPLGKTVSWPQRLPHKRQIVVGGLTPAAHFYELLPRCDPTHFLDSSPPPGRSRPARPRNG